MISYWLSVDWLLIDFCLLYFLVIGWYLIVMVIDMVVEINYSKYDLINLLVIIYLWSGNFSKVKIKEYKIINILKLKKNGYVIECVIYIIDLMVLLFFWRKIMILLLWKVLYMYDGVRYWRGILFFIVIKIDVNNVFGGLSGNEIELWIIFLE